MKKVDLEVAKKDFEKWLDFKKIRERKREDNADFGEKIIDGIVSGDIIVKDDCKLNVKLRFPLLDENKKPVHEVLIFKPRIQVWELNKKLKGVKADDGDGRIAAYIAALTEINKGLVEKMDTEDSSLCQSIVMYFL